MIFLALLQLLSSPVETDVLFIPEHAGETKDFIPVLEELKRQRKSFRILPLGTAKTLIDRETFSFEIIDIEDSKVERISELVKAKMVVTGVATLRQKEILELYKNKGVKTFAYWDNPEPRGAAPYFQTALKVQESAGFLLTPSKYVETAKEFSSRAPETKITVGKPSLEQWQKEIRHIAIAETIKKAHLSTMKPITTFVCTYGESYEKAFQLFVASVNKTPESQVIFQVHPASTGEFETKHCKEHLSPSIPYLVASSKSLSLLTMSESIAISDKVLTYNSSAGFQAFFAGKEVGFVVPETDPYTNSLIDTKAAMKISSEKDLAKFFQSKGNEDPEALFSQMGFPQNSTERFLETVLANCKE